MSNIENLHPHLLWKYFLEVCEIPRPSKKEDRIIAYLLDFAKKNKLEAKRDEIGNVIIFKKATKGKENVQPVVLQSHMDMVCEKHSEVAHDFDVDQRLYSFWYWRNKGTCL